MNGIVKSVEKKDQGVKFLKKICYSKNQIILTSFF